MKEITWNDFQNVELRVGTFIDVHDFPEAKTPAYKIIADFGKEIGIKKSSAQITALYKKEDLINKQIIGVVNFPPKQIGPFMSEFLVTGFVQEDGSVNGLYASIIQTICQTKRSEKIDTIHPSFFACIYSFL